MELCPPQNLEVLMQRGWCQRADSAYREGAGHVQVTCSDLLCREEDVGCAKEAKHRHSNLYNEESVSQHGAGAQHNDYQCLQWYSPSGKAPSHLQQ